MRTGSEGFYWALLLVLVVVWGSAFAFLKTAVTDMHPAWVAAYRLWLACAVLAGCAVVAKEPPLVWALGRASPVVWYGAVGVLGMALPFLCFSWASTALPSAVTAICNGASPIFTALFAHYLIAGERMNVRKSLGVALGFGGLLALVGPAAAADLAGASTIAELVAVLGAALYAAASVAIKRAPPLGSVSGALVMALGGAVTATLAALVWAGPPPTGTGRAWLSILYLGVFPTALASIGYIWLVRRRGALFVSFATYLAPVWATLIGLVLLGERLRPEAFAALLLILAGVAAANLRLPRDRTAAAE